MKWAFEQEVIWRIENTREYRDLWNKCCAIEDLIANYGENDSIEIKAFLNKCQRDCMIKLEGIHCSDSPVYKRITREIQDRREMNAGCRHTQEADRC